MGVRDRLGAGVPFVAATKSPHQQAQRQAEGERPDRRRQRDRLDSSQVKAGRGGGLVLHECPAVHIVLQGLGDRVDLLVVDLQRQRGVVRVGGVEQRVHRRDVRRVPFGDVTGHLALGAAAVQRHLTHRGVQAVNRDQVQRPYRRAGLSAVLAFQGLLLADGEARVGVVHDQHARAIRCHPRRPCDQRRRDSNASQDQQDHPQAH